MHKNEQPSAVVVLPPGMAGRIPDPDNRRWLAGTRLHVTRGKELLDRALAALGLTVPQEGLAALRLWGQTGEKPDSWVAAADPVYLEPQRDRLFVHALSAAELPQSELRSMFEHLQNALASDRPYAFELLGALGYLHSTEPLATASVPAANVPEVVGDSMVAGDTAAHDRLQSELQMCLHDFGINQRRMDAGRRPVNALWFWGGGRAPAPVERVLPRLFGDDPLFSGFWRSSGARAEAWPGSLTDCVQASPEGFVAIAPEVDVESGGAVLDRELANLRRVLAKRGLRRTTLLFRDGLQADARWSDSWRFWRRRREPILEPPGGID